MLFLPPMTGNGKCIHVYTTYIFMVIFLGDGPDGIVLHKKHLWCFETRSQVINTSENLLQGAARPWHSPHSRDIWAFILGLFILGLLLLQRSQFFANFPWFFHPKRPWWNPGSCIINVQHDRGTRFGRFRRRHMICERKTVPRDFGPFKSTGTCNVWWKTSLIKHCSENRFLISWPGGMIEEISARLVDICRLYPFFIPLNYQIFILSISNKKISTTLD